MPPTDSPDSGGTVIHTSKTIRAAATDNGAGSFHYGRLNEKIDVYSYGVVLLELITGQLAIIESDDLDHIVEWVNPEFQNEDLTIILDRRIRGEFDVNSVWNALETAMACTTFTSHHRATMAFVLCQLTQCLEIEVSRHRERTPG
ncbi:probable LRR receptor-like serine/threonine-protein kinase At5g59680 [Pyrus x bretschneideri]|uniref:probable LRR receptor-like serine/threonine-protein kinase At5g59680 n=1 Tax=Pyrus x bretschneideri TaxID=225117 RepID=UPI0020300982|nr:probable LRR receptor-like serine/threonine-protein kinase At5g59680 [Pyrus x bretschneideri]